QDTIDHFKNLSTDTGIPYQTLINLYLTCGTAQRTAGSSTSRGAARPAPAQRDRTSPESVAYGFARRPTNPARSLRRSTAQAPGTGPIPA
ncbi:MAG: hypothetical protein OXG35_32870, partial [Acidobacteria bacterium]|nr:hypothetical protein [Acidobacteriota bacterium]